MPEDVRGHGRRNAGQSCETPHQFLDTSNGQALSPVGDKERGLTLARVQPSTPSKILLDRLNCHLVEHNYKGFSSLNADTGQNAMLQVKLRHSKRHHFGDAKCRVDQCQ